MDTQIGKKIYQSAGFNATVLNPFPQKELSNIPQSILLKTNEAERIIGKLDGVTYDLPDIDFFLKMFATKEATDSSHIEGTKATLIDALKQKVQDIKKPSDVDDISYYVKALNYGVKRLKGFPVSLRFIREIHKTLMEGARATHHSNPGEFRRTQNYIGGTKPSDALFVPPPVNEIQQALDDFEKFLYLKNIPPLIHLGLIHSQFETIHPFLDGNGRTGRILITLLLCEKQILEKPVLFLSSFFKKHRQEYYQKLNDYHHNGKVENWIDFFLSAVLETAKESIKVSKEIKKLREEDMNQMQSLGKRESTSSVKVLSHLFAEPIVDTSLIMKWTSFTRPGAIQLINRFIKLNILEEITDSNHSKIYVYKRYINIFTK